MRLILCRLISDCLGFTCTPCFNLSLVHALTCLKSTPYETFDAAVLSFSPCGLTISWWVCYGLCVRYRPTELAHSVYSVLVSVVLALSTKFNSRNSPDISLCFLTLFFWSYFCLIGPFNYISLYESLSQSWYNPLWFMGLKALTYYFVIQWDIAACCVSMQT